VADLSDVDYHSLADFRLAVRRFLHFSEAAAHAEELEPQQHQMLLAIRALTEGDSAGPNVGQLAEHLLLRHHSAVGLLDRLEQRGLVERARADADRRQVRVHLTGLGAEKLHRLSSVHRAELLTSGPQLVEALRGVLEAQHEAVR
jgi:DNA-binding MarR family transcriptional regulator